MPTTGNTRQPENPGEPFLPRPGLPVQVLGWCALVAYEQAAVILTTRSLSALRVSILYYALNITLFYSHWYLLRYTIRERRRRYLPALLLTLAELAAFLALKYGANLLVTTGHPMTTRQTLISSLWDLHRSLYFIALSTLTWSVAFIGHLRHRTLALNNARLLAERDNARLEVSLSAARQAYYRQQLNPHLLFNTLNFIYSRVAATSAEAAKGVLLLSDLLRYSLEAGEPAAKIPLDRELEQIGKLIDISRLRYSGRCYLDYRAETGEATADIIPLLLLTLSENVFKHGLLTDPARPAILHITCHRNHLVFHSRNYRKRPGPAREDRTGLQNTRIRLGQSYPGRHTLNIREDPDTYELQLNLYL
jgi:sensor histidine kinase YesM